MVNNDSCCIAKILKVIEILQKNVCGDEFPEGCDKPFLGPSLGTTVYNTRPINLYTRAGDLFTANYINSEGESLTTTVFRVERVNDCCCKLRLLASTDTGYTATNNYINVNLKCMCAISCLEDIALENVC